MKNVFSTKTTPLATTLATALCCAASHAQTCGDFNGDGFDDLVVGVPYENIGSRIAAGSLHVIYGSAGKLKASGSKVWHQNAGGIVDSAEIDDRWGSALAAGDFNGDGFDDLAVGIPGEDIGFIFDAGAVAVLYGGTGGLGSAKNQFWHQDSKGIKDVAEEGDGFGSALAAGDFNRDGYFDLAIGVPGEDIGEAIDNGMVHVLYGTNKGLHKKYNQTWWQGRPGVLDAPDSGDRFGASLVAADFTGDRIADLAVGVPGHVVNGQADAGMVHVFLGTSSRLTAAGNSVWTQDDLGVDPSEADDQFGFALAAGDFNRDRKFDLVIGVPFEDVDGMLDAGIVHIMYSDASGPTTVGTQLWRQDSVGGLETVEERDWFGYAVAAGDFNRDRRDDLAIGAPYETLGEHVETGCVISLMGSPAGLITDGARLWQQDDPKIPGDNAQWDNFGSSLTVGDFNNDKRMDLVIGTPGDDYNGIIDVGSAVVLYSRANGLASKNSQFWHQDCPGVADRCEPGDYFGHSVSR